MPHSHRCFGVTHREGLLLLSWLWGSSPWKLLQTDKEGTDRRKEDLKALIPLVIGPSA